MEQIMNYVKPELIVVAIVLYFCGMALKQTQVVKDKYIPMLLGAGGIVLCGIWVLATSPLGNGQEIAMAVFTAIVQGVLMAGVRNFLNQDFKKGKKKHPDCQKKWGPRHNRHCLFRTTLDSHFHQCRPD